jgi:sporulation protein YlmC with PRC-barrel domain
MYVTDLRGLRIFSLMSALRMGAVSDALLDPSCRYVAALVVRQNAPGTRHLVPRRLVSHVGRNAVMLVGTDETPEELHVEDADRLIDLNTFVGLEVVTDYGNLVGRVHNAVLDHETLSVVEYVVEGRGFERLLGRHGMRHIDAAHTLSASKDVVIVPESALGTTPDPAHDAAGEQTWERERPWVAPGALDGADEASASTT